jgi:tRNA A37 threonylcarbamoyladenosine synthetase subunit TsaC/SUA5/YrdC
MSIIATEHLRKGEVIAAPSSTVFALLATKDGLDNLYKIKQRDKTKPTQVLVASIDDARRLVDFTPLAERHLELFEGGGLTMVLGEYAIRLDKTLASIIAPFGYLYASSCNRAGEATAKNALDAKTMFPDIYVVEGGSGELASTIADMRGEQVIILRQGLTIISE